MPKIVEPEAPQTHPDNDALTNIAVEVDFSDYQPSNELFVPLHVQQYLQGGLVLDVVFTNVVMNSASPRSSWFPSPPGSRPGKFLHRARPFHSGVIDEHINRAMIFVYRRDGKCSSHRLL